jgi:large-conductance mechanosensitive channel
LIKKYKILITAVSLLTIVIVFMLTIDVIYETDNWKWFSVDFDKRDHIISAYGTLIGGVLAFLAILFVIYQVLEQREQIFNEKKDEAKEKIEEQKDILKLISSFLDSIIGDIKNQGERLEKYYKQEQQYPTLSNQTYFTVNENFNRIVEMDYLIIYKSFRHFFKNEKDWEKKFLNFYRSIDFYFKITPHIRENYTSQLAEKVKLKYTIQDGIQTFLKKFHQYRNKYIQSYTPPFNINSFDWFRIMNKFWLQYRNYVKFIENSKNKAKLDSDLSDLKTTYFEPLFDDMLQLKIHHINTSFGEEELLEDLGDIIIKIKQLEVFALNYANDIKEYCTSYYIDDNPNLKNLIVLKELIDTTLKKKT